MWPSARACCGRSATSCSCSARLRDRRGSGRRDRAPRRRGGARCARQRSGRTERAQDRLERYGLNRLPELRRRSPLLRFVAQFGDFLAVLLEVAGTITLRGVPDPGRVQPQGRDRDLRSSAAQRGHRLRPGVPRRAHRRGAQAAAPRPCARAARRCAGGCGGRRARARRRGAARRRRRDLGRRTPGRRLRARDERRCAHRRVRAGAAQVRSDARGRAAHPGAQLRLRGNKRGVGPRARSSSAPTRRGSSGTSTALPVRSTTSAARCSARSRWPRGASRSWSSRSARSSSPCACSPTPLRRRLPR